MPNPTHDYEQTESELHTLLGEQEAHPQAHPSLALLRAFGQDVLSQEVERRIEQHLRRCRTCSMLLADLDTLPEPTLSDLQNNRITARIPNAPGHPVVPPRFRLLPWAGAVAASLFLAAGTLYFMSARRHMPREQVASGQLDPTRTGASPAPPIAVAALEIPIRPLAPPSDRASELQTRGSTSRNPPTQALVPAFAAYRRGDYAAAAKRFESLSVSYPHSDLVSLYLGVAQLLDHQEQAADLSLQRARKLAPRSDAAQWYGALAALHVHSADARPLLDTLCRNSGSVYSAESCRVAASLH